MKEDRSHLQTLGREFWAEGTVSIQRLGFPICEKGILIPAAAGPAGLARGPGRSACALSTAGQRTHERRPDAPGLNGGRSSVAAGLKGRGHSILKTFPLTAYFVVKHKNIYIKKHRLMVPVRISRRG